MDNQKYINMIRGLLIENAYCEDNTLRIKSKLKYDLYNFMKENDLEFIKWLHEKLEYNDED